MGGGGGTVSIDEIRAFRTGPLGQRKAEQIRATGAKYLVSPCANCKKQLRELCEDNGLDDVEVIGLHDLLLRVVDLKPDAPKVEDREAVEETEQELCVPASVGGCSEARFEHLRRRGIIMESFFTFCSGPRLSFCLCFHGFGAPETVSADDLANRQDL